MDELYHRQNRLQRDAKRQLDELHLRELLSPFGEVILVGSVVTGLMTWPDIDIEVIVEQLPSKDTVGELGRKLFSHDDMVRVWLMDNREKGDPHQPRGLYLGGKRKVGQEIWKFDMWFLLRDDQRSGKDDLIWIIQALTPEKKDIILQIKDKISDNPKYRKTIFSIDIYQAVLKEGITSLSEFRDYLEKTGRSL